MSFTSSQSFKALTVLSAFAIIAVNATNANAQVPPKSNINVTPSSAIKGQIGIGAGDYNFTNLDRTDVMKFYTNEITKRSQADLKYFKEQTAYVQSLFKKILDEDVWGPQGLNTYSKKSIQAGNGPASYSKVGDYLDAVNKFEQDALELQTAIGKMGLIVDAFPSQVPVDVNAGSTSLVKTSIPSYGQIKFDKVVDFYTNALNGIREKLNNLPQGIMPANSKVPVVIEANSGSALTPNIPISISSGALIDLQKQMTDLHKWLPFEENGKEYDPMDDFVKPYTTMVKTMVHEFISTFGQQERYRYDAHTQDLTEKKYKEYLDYFYGRSFMRAYFGMPIGTIGVKYKTLSFNLDKLFSPNTVVLLEQVIVDEQDYPSIDKAYANIVNVVNSRTQEVFGKKVNFFDRVNTAWTWLKGQNRLAVVNKMMFELLYEDFQEDQAIAQGRMKDFKKMFDTRYKGTGEQVNYFNTLKPKYVNLIKTYVDPSLELSDEANGATEDQWADGGNVISGGSSVMGSLTNAMIAFKSKFQDLGQAEEIAKRIAALTKIQQGQLKKGNKRLNDL